jgi:hypothetical protein
VTGRYQLVRVASRHLLVWTVGYHARAWLTGRLQPVWVANRQLPEWTIGQHPRVWAR